MKFLERILLLCLISVCVSPLLWANVVGMGKEIEKVAVKSSLVKIDYEADVVCLGAPFRLKADHSAYGNIGNFTYRWIDVAGSKEIGSESELEYTHTGTGEFLVGLEVRDAGKYIGGDTVPLFLTQKPVTVCVDDSVCAGAEATLSVSGGNYWLWDQGSTGPSITLYPEENEFHTVKASSYPLDGTYVNSCYTVDTAWITIRDTAVFVVQGDHEVCQGTEATIEVIGGSNVLWNGVWGSEVLNVRVDNDTVIYVRATDRYGCIADVVWPVQALELNGEIEVYISGSLTDTVCFGLPVKLEVYSEIADAYRWFDGSEDFYTEFVAGGDMTVYCDLIKKTYADECSVRLQRNIGVKNCGEAYFPTGFVLDGFTKTFGPIGVEDPEKEYTFSIFDSRGVRVFYTTEFSEGWDGTYKGKYVQPGHYVYYFTETKDGVRFEKKGMVTVIK